MRPVLLLFLFSLHCSTLTAQQSTLTFDGEKLPVFRKGQSDLINYLSDSIRYPSYAVGEFIEGKVVLKVLISDSGNVSAVSIIKPVHSSLDSEAVRVIKSMPPWNPAMIGSKPVPFELTLPILFSLGLRKPELQMEWTENSNTSTYELPQFPGGEVELKRFVYKNLKYPPAALRDGIEGMITVQFYILEDGRIEYIDANNLGWDLKEEAVRIVKLMPYWRPGSQNGRPSKAIARLSIPFIIR